MKNWSIQKRFSFTFAVTGLFLVVGLLVAIQISLWSRFNKVDELTVADNLARVEKTYQYFLDSFHAKVADWGQWDDTYEFVSDLNSDYIESNLVEATLVNLKTDELLFFNSDKELVYATASSAIFKKESNFPGDVESIFLEHSEIWDSIQKNGHFSGLVKTEDGVLIYSASQIVKSDATGPARGVIVFGRYIGKWLTDELSNISRIPVYLDTQNTGKKTKDVIYTNYSIPVHGSDSVDLVFETKRDIRNQVVSGMYILLTATILLVTISIAFNYYSIYNYIILDLQNLKRELSVITEREGNGRMKRGGITSDIDEIRDDLNYLLENLDKAKMSHQQKAEELKMLNDLMVDREIKMTELKAVIADLKKKIL